MKKLKGIKNPKITFQEGKDIDFCYLVMGKKNNNIMVFEADRMDLQNYDIRIVMDSSNKAMMPVQAVKLDLRLFIFHSLYRWRDGRKFNMTREEFREKLIDVLKGIMKWKK